MLQMLTMLCIIDYYIVVKYIKCLFSSGLGRQGIHPTFWQGKIMERLYLSVVYLYVFCVT